uniref:Uncharacterized protein n=1 Tax=Anguilla anguilla TaxID=7936 RepID=A0A0E9SS24_ANGAN
MFFQRNCKISAIKKQKQLCKNCFHEMNIQSQNQHFTQLN